MTPAEIEAYLDEHKRKWSPNTVDRYRWYLLNLAKWLEEHRVAEPTRADLIRWLDSRMRWSASAQYTATISVRGYYRWLLGREESPAEKVPLPRRVYKPQRVLNNAQVQAILAHFDVSTPKGIRDRALIMLLLDSGLRAAEITRLRIEHLNLPERRANVRVKGGKWGPLVYSGHTAECLAVWLAVREKVAAKTTAEVFCSIGGLTPGRRMTVSGLRVCFRRIGQALGFHFSPHDLRRTMAHMGVRNGAPESVLMEAMRLDSPAQIRTYTREIRAEDFRPYLPVDHLAAASVE